MKTTILKSVKLKTSFLILFVGLMTISLQSCSSDDNSFNPLKSEKFNKFDSAMQKLWADHMQYTFLTVDAFYNNMDALDAQMTRLLANQEHIGDAIKPYYGEEAGEVLTQLLKEHILGAVPVLTAAQNGDEEALDLAVADWFANGADIAEFLSTANPENWTFEGMKHHMDDHLFTTIDYAVDLLQKNYERATQSYDTAFGHMMGFSHELAVGIALQFPIQF